LYCPWMDAQHFLGCEYHGKEASLLCIMPPLSCSISYSCFCLALSVLLSLRTDTSYLKLSDHATTLRLLRLPTHGLPHLHRPHHYRNGHRHHRPIQKHHTSVLRYWKYWCSVMGCTRRCPIDHEKEQQMGREVTRAKTQAET